MTFIASGRPPCGPAEAPSELWTLRRLAALSMTILIGSGCGVTIGQRNVLATRSAVLPPMVEGVTRRNVELVVDQGVTLRGWHLQRPNARRVVVFFHGNGAGILSSDWALHWFTTAFDADVVAFDARGYGFSEGEASVDAIVEDSFRVIAFLNDLGLGERPLVIVGQSMGTASAIHLAAHLPAAALVLISPFSSYRDIVQAVRRAAPWYAHVTADTSLTGLKTSPLADLPKVTAPSLIIHGTRDELSTEDVVRRVEQALGAQRKSICRFDGTHNDAQPMTAAVRGCIEQFAGHIHSEP